MKPLSRVTALLLGMLAFLAVVTDVLVRRAHAGDFRIDEAHKISESAFLGLWISGDVQNSAWFANVLDRTNPPVGKYLFGAAILAGGHPLPALPTLAVHSPDGGIPAFHKEPLSAPYRRLLPSVRLVSALAVAMTAALLVTTLGRYHGWVSAAAAFVFFAFNDLTMTSRAWAVFDPLLSLFFTLGVALTTSLAAATTTRRAVVTAVLIGTAAALAFQTRLNGLWMMVIAVPFVAVALRRTPRRAILALATTAVAFTTVVLALNPFYWSAPKEPVEAFASDAGILRPAERIAKQYADLSQLAAPLQEGRTEARTLPEKIRYLFEIVMLDAIGVVIMISVVAGLIAWAARIYSFTDAIQLSLAMSTAVILIMAATLPLPWPRYLLVTAPPLALIGGCSVAEGFRVIQQISRRAERVKPASRM